MFQNGIDLGGNLIKFLVLNVQNVLNYKFMSSVDMGKSGRYCLEDRSN